MKQHPEKNFMLATLSLAFFFEDITALGKKILFGNDIGFLAAFLILEGLISEFP